MARQVYRDAKAVRFDNTKKLNFNKFPPHDSKITIFLSKKSMCHISREFHKESTKTEDFKAERRETLTTRSYTS